MLLSLQGSMGDRISLLRIIFFFFSEATMPKDILNVHQDGKALRLHLEGQAESQVETDYVDGMGKSQYSQLHRQLPNFCGNKFPVGTLAS